MSRDSGDQFPDRREDVQRVVDEVAATGSPRVIRQTEELPEHTRRHYRLVDRFAHAMRRRFREKSDRGDWLNKDLGWAFVRLAEETGELAALVTSGADPQFIQKQAADIANFALVIDDLYERWNRRTPFSR